MVDVIPVCRLMVALFSPVLNFESMPTIEGVSFANLIFYVQVRKTVVYVYGILKIQAWIISRSKF